jgi:hypothetical protein
MSVRIREGRNHEGRVDGANLYDSVTGWAFGPSFDSYEDAEAFERWATHAKGSDDLRKLDTCELGELFAEWRQREAVEV